MPDVCCLVLHSCRLVKHSQLPPVCSVVCLVFKSFPVLYSPDLSLTLLPSVAHVLVTCDIPRFWGLFLVFSCSSCFQFCTFKFNKTFCLPFRSAPMYFAPPHATHYAIENMRTVVDSSNMMGHKQGIQKRLLNNQVGVQN